MNDVIVAELEPATRMLLTASSAEEAKQVVDIANAAKTYALRHKLGKEAVSYAHAVLVDAQTLLGGFLKGMEKNKGRRGQLKGRDPSGDPAVQSPEDPAPTLAQLGITLNESSDAQALDTLKAESPEQHAEVRANKKSIRAAAAACRREKKKQEKKRAQAAAVAALDSPRYRVDQADCLEWFALQPADSLDLVFGSPPYEDARLYLEDGDDRGIARTRDEWVAWMVEVYRAALVPCKGLVAFVVEGRTKKYRWSASPALLMAALDAAGIHLRKPPVYHRVGIPGSGGPDWLRNDYEFVVCATRGGELPWSENTAMGAPPKYDPGGEPSHRRQDGSRANAQSGPATSADRGNEGHHRARWAAGSSYAPPDVANPGNVITCKVGGGNIGDKLAHENEAPFPEGLVKFFVRSFCPPEGVVCDPFSGSGTTGAVAVSLGRRFRGCDVRKSQVALSRRRIAKVQPPLPLMEA
jgi:hypothetical protein